MNWADFHFIRPLWLIALLPAAVVFVLFLKHRFNRGNWATVCDEALMPYILEEGETTKSYGMLAVLMSAAILGIVAMAGPTWERLETPTFTSDAALVIALDLSPTMNATDIKPSRLARAKFKIADILRQRKDGLTALVVYSADAFTVTPLTNDIATIENQLSALESSIMPAAGKNTVAALQQSVNLLAQAGQQEGDVLLITDAIENDDVLDKDTMASYRLSVLGVGTADGGPVKMERGGFLKDNQGNIVLARLKAAQLSAIAQQRKGRYHTMTADDRDIKSFINFFDRTTNANIEQESGVIEQWNDLGAWLLLLALPLAALSFRKGFLVLCLLVILPMPNTSYAFEWDDLWTTKNQQAQQAFAKEEFEQAAESFEAPEWKAAAQYKAGDYQQAVAQLQQSQTTDGLYNKGNAYAKLGDYEKAIEAYESALKKNPNNDDAKHNLKLVKDAQQEQQKQNNDKQEGKDQQNDEQKEDSKENSQDNDKSDGEKPPENEEAGEDSKSEGQPDPKAKEQDAEPKEPQPSEKESQDEATDEEKKAEQAKPQSLSDEKKQAAEQWLNRIEDDPAGLLKRKFKYQYGQRRKTR
jgi:Ca-activated chloride channel family protein